MSEAESLFGDEHVRRYRETGGEVGHVWRGGATILLLTTTGRTSGERRTVPLIYVQEGNRYAIVASKGGAPDRRRRLLLDDVRWRGRCGQRAASFVHGRGRRASRFSARHLRQLLRRRLRAAV